MTTPERDRDALFQLLPAVYRERDAAQGYPLRALLRLVADQAAILRGDIQQLWDNFFIETCQSWVIPYIGDLVSNRLLHDASRTTADTAHALFPDLVGRDLQPDIAARKRADVAKTIYYRRRKGALPMLEELARDVTGWAAHAVEFLPVLAWTQHLNYQRPARLVSPDLRRVGQLTRLNGPFDTIAHTVDVRAPRQNEGWYNIPNLGFFLWRLRSYPLRNVPARQADKKHLWRYHFSPLGNPAPLFRRRRREGDEAGLATELDLPGPISCRLFQEDLQRYWQLAPPRPLVTDLYGPWDPLPGENVAFGTECSFFIVRNDQAIFAVRDANAAEKALAPQIIHSRLDPWPNEPPPGQVLAVDVETGRIAVGSGWKNRTTRLDVSFHYGFSADLGGGPYERSKWLVRPELAEVRYQVKEDGAAPATHASLRAALSAWRLHPERNTLIQILDSRTYDLPPSITMSDHHGLVIEAANGERPVLRTGDAGIAIQVSPARGNLRQGALTLSGVIVEGFLHVTGDLGRLRLLHTTLVPGRSLKPEDGRPGSTDPSLIVEAGPDRNPINEQLRVEIAYSITGPLHLPEHSQGLWLLDSIVDGLGGIAIAIPGISKRTGPPATLERATIFGPSYLKELSLASEVIFTGPVVVERRQHGCVRFSFVPPGSHTPRRYQCQPDLEISKRRQEAPDQAEAIRKEIEGRLSPSFTTTRYGQPGYGQLHPGCPVQIQTGAEDGSEMGVFSHLHNPQREANLRLRLEEYLPFGLDSGFIYVT